MKQALRIVVALAVLACAPQAIASDDSGRAYTSLTELPPLSDYEKQLKTSPDGEPATILVSSGYKRDSWNETRFTTVRRIKILAKEGKGYASVRFRVGADEWVSDIAGRTVLPDGRVLELQTDDVKYEAVYDGIWGPEFIYNFRLPRVEEGSVIEYSYTVETQLGPGMRFNRWYLQSWVRTLQTRYTLDVPADFLPFSADIDNLSTSAKPESEQENGRRIITYRFADVPGLRREPLMPPPHALFGCLTVDYRWPRSRTANPNQFWLQYGRDQALRAAAFTENRGGVAELVDSAVRKDRGTRELVSDVCTWVQNNIVYLSTLPPEKLYSDEQFQYWENESVSDVLQNRYGSQMDISLLSLAMLREAGAEAYLALSVNRESNVLRPELLEPHQFDQALIAVILPDEGILFTHPGAPNCPPPDSPWYVQGALALVCTPGGGAFARVPVDLPSENLFETFFELTVNEEGDAVGRISTTIRGQDNMRLKNILLGLDPAKLKEAIQSLVWSHLKTMEIGQTTVSNLMDFGEPLVLEATVRAPGFASRQNNRLTFNPGALARPPLLSLEEERRAQPIYLPYPYTDRILVRIAVPEGYRVERSAPGTYQSDIGRLQTEVEILPGGAVWRRELKQERVFSSVGSPLR